MVEGQLIAGETRHRDERPPLYRFGEKEIRSARSRFVWRASHTFLEAPHSLGDQKGQA